MGEHRSKPGIEPSDKSVPSPRLSPPVDAALLEFVWLELAFPGTRQCQPHPVVGITT
jgi:hypothetical protein